MTEYSVKVWSLIITGENKFFDLALCRESLPGLVPKFYIIFVFHMTHLSSYNIFVTETRYFWGNMKVLLGDLYTHQTSDGADITRQLTK